MSRKHRRKNNGGQKNKAPVQKGMYGVPGFRGVDFVIMECPQCKKRRMRREKGHVVSVLTTISLDNAKKRFIDVCSACTLRFINEDDEYQTKRVQEATKALEEKQEMKGNTSIEDAL